MTSPTPGAASNAPGGPEGRPARSRRYLTAGWGAALVRGLAATAVSAALGQAVAFVIAAVGSLGVERYSLSVGWLYTCLFNRVPITIEPKGSFLDALGEGSNGRALSGSIGFALLTGTVAVVIVLVAGGREVASATGGGRLERVVHGAKVGLVYAAAIFAISLVVQVDFPASGEASATLRPSTAGAFLFPLAIGVVTGGVGGYRSARSAEGVQSGRTRRLDVALSGGWRMFVLGIALSFAGLAGLAVVRPDQTSAYLRWVVDRDRTPGVDLFGHQLLALPNHGMFILAPAMGSCDGVYGRDISIDVLCLGRIADVDLRLLSPRTGEAPVPRDAPPEFLVLLLVPALACVIGGRFAARAARLSHGGWLFAGAGAGVAFAVCCGVGAWLSGARVSGNLFVDPAGAVFYGPRPLTTGLLALAWGVVGGGVGALSASRHPFDGAREPGGTKRDAP